MRLRHRLSPAVPATAFPCERCLFAPKTPPFPCLCLQYLALHAAHAERAERADAAERQQATLAGQFDALRVELDSQAAARLELEQRVRPTTTSRKLRLVALWKRNLLLLPLLLLLLLLLVLLLKSPGGGGTRHRLVYCVSAAFCCVSIALPSAQTVAPLSTDSGTTLHIVNAARRWRASPCCCP